MIYARRIAGLLCFLTIMTGCAPEPGTLGRQELTGFYEQELEAANDRLIERIRRLDRCIAKLDSLNVEADIKRPEACDAATAGFGRDAYFIKAVEPVLASYQQAVTRAVRDGHGDQDYVTVAKLVDDYESLKELYLIRHAQAQVYARRIDDLEHRLERRAEADAASEDRPADTGTGDRVPEIRFDDDRDERED